LPRLPAKGTTATGQARSAPQDVSISIAKHPEQLAASVPLSSLSLVVAEGPYLSLLPAPHRNKENKEIFSQISEANIITPQRPTDEARGRKRKASSEAAEAGGETDADVLSAPAPAGTHFSLGPFSL
jgi:hypothetical protein